MNIPDGLIKKAINQGMDNKWVTYRFADERALQRTEADTMGNRGLLRMARCRLPAVPSVVQHMRRQFTKFDAQSWLHEQENIENDTPSNTDSTETPNPIATELVRVCAVVIDYYIYNEPNVTNPYNTPGCTYIGSECVEYTLVDTGGGDPPPDSPGGSSGDEGDPCEPSMPCSLQPGGGEGTAPEGCEVETDYEIVAPCDTGNGILDSQLIQNKMDEIWDQSFGTDDVNGLPHDQRNEAMFAVEQDQSGNLNIIEIPADSTTNSCQFNTDGTVNINQNLVALFHTHPYSDGDTVNDPRCDETGSIYNADSVSEGDSLMIKQVKDNPVLPAVPMYIMDKDKIRVIEPNSPSQYSNAIDRCGYKANL